MKEITNNNRTPPRYSSSHEQRNDQKPPRKASTKWRTEPALTPSSFAVLSSALCNIKYSVKLDQVPKREIRTFVYRRRLTSAVKEAHPIVLRLSPWCGLSVLPLRIEYYNEDMKSLQDHPHRCLVRSRYGLISARGRRLRDGCEPLFQSRSRHTEQAMRRTSSQRLGVYRERC